MQSTSEIVVLTILLLSNISLIFITLILVRRLNRKLKALPAIVEYSRLIAGTSSTIEGHSASISKTSFLASEEEQKTRRALSFLDSSVVRSRLEMLENKPVLSAVPIGYAMARAIKKVEPTLLVSGRSDIVICSVATGNEYKKAVQPCLDTHIKFAQKQGLTYVLLEKEPVGIKRPPPWMKLPLIMQQIQKGSQYVFYIDADAMITNYEFDISTLCHEVEQENKTILLTEDESAINSGVMLFRSCNEAHLILELTWLYDVEPMHPLYEQAALIYLMENFQAVADEILIEPDARRFNSFPLERRSFHSTLDANIWFPGDFVCHFSGIRSPNLDKMIKDYNERLS